MKLFILDMYTLLLKRFGPQGWWPLTPAKKAEREAESRGSNRRTIGPVHHPLNTTKKLTNRDQTEIMIGAILTQNTAWTNVELALANLNRSGLMDFNKIAKTRHAVLASSIRSAGYFNQKAKRLKLMASYVVGNYDGNLELLEKKSLPVLRQELLSLNGIGPETADCMVLYAFGKPSFVVDAYTRRIFERIGIIKSKDTYDSIQALFHKHLLPNSRSVFLNPNPLSKTVLIFKEYHALIVELAKRNCRKVPDCQSCPLRTDCKTGIAKVAEAEVFIYA